ncbi:nucleotidyltransferase family protein [Subsaxibacter sp. CAU 1640]|uniref:nucleotidyltransferase family protein n=1 Tax=Subsaxibacter sp. CAU 1640 TaxID=2933271 RepID=UPI002006C404|nr:nucleotidyltransferase family protein [Subsaxibacter sp. CAU 1640]MCK7590244.1 nucleotidyltransferase family protein [Subsaxibacter sp. CAU 1640]
MAQKHSLKQTFQLIIDILSFEISTEQLADYFTKNQIDWDLIVIVASEHLILPAVYCRLQQRSLLGFLPEDLTIYLKEITNLNRERNKTLLFEAKQVSHLFKSHQIEHVFVKGIALLAADYYQDHGERMIGDIDILVASKDIDRAFDLLTSAGYNKFLPFNYEVKNFRHKPRQISEKHLGAIELHHHLIRYEFRKLVDAQDFITDTKVVNQITVPKATNIVKNSVFAHQINDRCYFYNTLKLKILYDILVIEHQEEKPLLIGLAQQKYASRFIDLASIFVPKFKSNLLTVSQRHKQQLYLWSLDFPRFGKASHWLRVKYVAITERFKLIFFNNSYRRHIFERRLFK